ncbi:APC family permease [Nocardia heshunensis]
MADSKSPRGTLSVARVVYLVIAAAAPLAAIVGTAPLAVLYGNGAGLPAAFAVGTIVMLCFSTGYAAMSKYVVNTGAFFTYIARGIGRPPAMAAAYLAVLSYVAAAIGLAGAFGYFVQIVLDTEGVRIAWEWPSAIALLTVGILGYRSLTLSSRILGLLMLVEFSMLLVFDLGVVAHKGAAALPATSFTPHAALAGSFGVGLMFALTNFIGVEGAALYSEETKDPKRAVGRATLISVISIGVFYVLTAWIIVGAAGPDRIHDEASRRLGNLVFDQAAMYVSPSLRDLMAVFLCTSVLASMLALHNSASRYLFVLGREQVLPAPLGRIHTRWNSPHVASLTVTAVCTVVVGLFAVGGLDPYLTLTASMTSLATLGIIILQAMAATAVVAFFVRMRTGVLAIVTSSIGAIGLTAAFVLVVSHFSEFTNTGNRYVTSAPWLLPIALAAGLIAAFYLRNRRPDIYRDLAQSTLRDPSPAPTETSPTPVATATD